MLFSKLLALTLVPAAFGAWGDRCNGRNSAGDAQDGVCISTTQCSGNVVSGACPNDPANVKCCYETGCVWVLHNRCPGGSNVKCWAREGHCIKVEAGKCPGGKSYMKNVGTYFQNGRVVKC